MTTFWTLLKSSVITQSVITILLVITVCVMAIMQLAIPSFIENLTLLTVGFWIGSKMQYSAVKTGV
jgi:uncharacterized membrane protein AbrB (regulator of aidB expression)